MSDLKQKTVHGLFWRLVERLGSQVVGLATTIVLSRLLSPSDFGTVAMLTIFLSISQVFVGSGFGSALVRKKDATPQDYNTIFYLSLGLSIILYGVLFVSAPYIADYYKQPILSVVLRISAISLVLNAAISIQGVMIARDLRFKESCKIGIIQSIVSGVIGISLALSGWGVWALVWSSLIGSVCNLFTTWFLIRWRPMWIFSWASLKELWGFSGKMLASSLLDSIFTNLYGLIIGRVYTVSDLAFYNKGRGLPGLIMGTLDNAIGNVSYPVLAKQQHDVALLRNTMRRMITSSCFVVFPAMFGLAFCSKAVILILYGDKWLETVPYMQVGCFLYVLWPFHTVNLRAIMAQGRSDIFFNLEVIKKVITAVAVMLSYRYGAFELAVVSAFVCGPLNVMVNAWPNSRLLGYSLKMQVMDILPAGLMCLPMSVLLYILDKCFVNPFVALPIQIAAGMLSYVGLAYLFKVDVFFYLIAMLQNSSLARNVFVSKVFVAMLARRAG